MNKTALILYLTLVFLMPFGSMQAQKQLEQRISDSLNVIANEYIRSERINRITITPYNNKKLVTITTNEPLGHLPFRKENVDRIYRAMQLILGTTYPDYTIQIEAYGTDIRNLIPNHLNDKVDSSRLFRIKSTSPPLVTNISRPFKISAGLHNRYIALWNSHGVFYNQSQRTWMFQRPNIFQSVEDLLTTGFVLPFLAPMLENAGAQIFMPRERDIQIHEVIVDNDEREHSYYHETNDKYDWAKLEQGFANTKTAYLHKENPFHMGSSRFIQTTTDRYDISKAEWIPDIPEKGHYAVYVSYQTLPNSTQDAYYSVHHLGGVTEFKVNQTLYGGTWLYLGHFLFDQGRDNDYKVVLTNLSSDPERIVSADAVKFGGGMGNIARIPKSNNDTTIMPVISNFPRFAEGSRYWLQWAGVPDSVYSRTDNTNDYSDDFQSRGFWVNYLTGGSSVNPRVGGLGIPVDLAFAFHTDAGIKTNDTIIGTLGICSVNNTLGTPFYENGVSRWASRDMVDIIQTQIVDDIRRTLHKDWTRRGIWNRSYSESRVAEVPTMLLELLSHQNFYDMKLALDPHFRFTVSRAIYKGILKHIAYTNQQEYVVQPLPVDHFSSHFVSRNRLRLHWEAVNDKLEPTAVPTHYRIFTRIDEGGFDNGVLVQSNTVEVDINSGSIYSFKITAVNAGGESFPSEILSAYRDRRNRETILIVNGFDRVSGPEVVNLSGAMQGFINDKDAGVPYLWDASYIGAQHEFSPTAPYKSNLDPGFGASNMNYAGKIIAGNSFDYPVIHGKAIAKAGYSYVSTSVKGLMAGHVNVNDYRVIDLILGKQKQRRIGNLKNTPDFKTFPVALQQILRTYSEGGGNLLVSGAYLASDLYESGHPSDTLFLHEVLKIGLQEGEFQPWGKVSMHSDDFRYLNLKDSFNYHSAPNKESYHLERPDFLKPINNQSFVIGRFGSSRNAAGVAYSGSYKTCSLSIPFETIKEEEVRNKLMRSILTFLYSRR